MNTIGKLIKARTISFIEVLIKNYLEIGLNERETLIIGKLYYMYLDNNTNLSETKLANEMGLEPDIVASHIVDLCNKGFISIELKNGKEEFNLDGTIDKLGQILEGQEVSPKLNRQEEMHNITSYAERVFGRVLTTSDLNVVNIWLDEGYTLQDVRKAIDLSMRATHPSLKYADAIVVSEKERQSEPVEVDPELREVLEGINVKTK